MTNNLDRPDGTDPGRRGSGASSGDRARARAYFREFVPGMVAYAVVLVLVIIFGGLDGTAPSRFLWAVLPAIPLLWVLAAVVRHLHRLDDYQQRLMLDGFAVGFGVAMVAAVTVGLLEAAGLQSEVTGWVIFGAGMIGWGVASIAAGRR